jgi:hypothetical protein
MAKGKPPPKKSFPAPSRTAGKGGGGQPVRPSPTPGGPPIPVTPGQPSKPRPF